MLFKELLPQYNGDFENTEIGGVTCDSRKVTQGSVFVCIKGPDNDGHNYAKSALQNGAAVIVCEKDLGLANQVIVDDTHSVFSYMCGKVFDFPAKKLHIIGVTGTNGKTSVTYMLKKVLETAGHRVALIGTIQNMIGDAVTESHNTTPGVYELNAFFAKAVSEGCDYAVMEVSSHALHQRRVEGIEFDVAIFTNLTQDHLDYHKTMEEYLAAKKKLFYACKTAVINLDDPYAGKLMEGLDCNIVTYSLGNDSTYSAKSIIYRPASVRYQLLGGGKLTEITVNTGGKFTIYNSLAAAVAAIECGISAEIAAKGLSLLEGVKGRAEVVPCDLGFTVIIDYAHTPDGLKNILSTFKECEKNRLIVLFGCGGDRDKTKRPIMGNIAVHNADFVIVTSDNPRSEDPQAIIDDILVGTEGFKTPLKVIPNRTEAIKYAISIGMPGDIIVLAGKGHETYQILASGTVHLDEREVVAEAVSETKEKRKEQK